MRVKLEGGQSPHVVDSLLNAALESERLALSKNDDNNLTSLENGLDTDGESHAGHLVDIVVEETRVGKNGVVGEGLDTGAAGQAGAGLVEGNVAILTNTGEEKVNTTGSLDGVFIGNTLGLEVGGIAIEDVDIGRVDVYMREEVLPHERVVRLAVVARDTDVLVHVECDDIFKGDLYEKTTRRIG